MEYDPASGQVSKITDQLGQSVQYNYNVDGSVAKINYLNPASGYQGVSDISYAYSANNGKLLAQTELHFVFGGIDAVFGEPAGLDVAIENDDFVSALGYFLRGKHSSRSRADHEYGLHMVLRMLCNNPLATGLERRQTSLTTHQPGR